MIVRGCGGNEPAMLIEKMRQGQTFDEALGELQDLHGFRAPAEWKDLNRPLYNAELAPPADDTKKKK